MVTMWHGCYASGWEKGDCVDASFSHPAKYAKQLIFRIVQHLVRSGYVTPGGLVLDPFAGVGMGALACMAHGLRYVGCELEPRFVALAQQNLDLWRQRFGFTGATILQGDSQCLWLVLGEVDSCISSPPYAGNAKADYRVTDANGLDRDQRRGKRQGHGSFRGSETYGKTKGQLGAMPTGDYVISSPPYAGSVHDGNGIDQGKFTTIRNGRRVQPGKHTQAVAEGYGPTPGNLGNLPVGKFAGVVSSPPFGSTAPFQDKSFRLNDGRTTLPQGQEGYGTSNGQLGNTTARTFWSAASTIMAEVAAILKPGGVACWVVKGYIEKGKLVDFPAQWRQLCEAHGFVLLEEIHASLIESHGIQTGLFGEDTVEETARMSFFRLLHTRKYPHLAIRHETVLIFHKDLTP